MLRRGCHTFHLQLVESIQGLQRELDGLIFKLGVPVGDQVIQGLAFFCKAFGAPPIKLIVPRK